MDITAKMVKELRECTGAGMMDCKKALVETSGDVDAAVDVLRTKGLAALAKKADRATNEGIIGSSINADATVGVLVEVNCETDFVARNDDFKSFVESVAAHIAASAPADVAELMSQPFHGRDGITVEELLGETVGKLGENMALPRFSRFELSSDAGAIAVYIHGVGNIGVMAEVTASSADAASNPAFGSFCKDITMQIAATAPVAVTRENVDADVVAHELSIYKAQAAESGKPEQIQQKIAEGRLNKFYKEVTLLEQDFVKDSDITVKQHLMNTAKTIGGQIEIVRFERLVLGESTAESA